MGRRTEGKADSGFRIRGRFTFPITPAMKREFDSHYETVEKGLKMVREALKGTKPKVPPMGD